MVLGTKFVFRIGDKALQGDDHRLLIAVRPENMHRATFQASTAVEHAIPVVAVGPRQNVMHFHVQQDGSDP
jgi:hypothetical protein